MNKNESFSANILRQGIFFYFCILVKTSYKVNDKEYILLTNKNYSQ